MQPDDVEPAGTEPGLDGPEEVSVPQVPRTPDLPPPPEIEFRRPAGLRRSGVNSDLAPTGMDRAGSPEANSDLGSAGRIGAGLSISVTFAASVIVGLAMGQFVDRHWPPVAPYGMIVLGLAGLAAGFINLHRLINTLLPTNKGK